MIRIENFCRMLGAIILASLATTAVSAAEVDQPPFQEGVHYTLVEDPLPLDAAGKAQVMEVFTYACSHCAELQPWTDAWKATMDPDRVEFRYLPAVFGNSRALLLFARGYFTAEALGMDSSVHATVFKRLWSEGESAPPYKRFRSIEDLAKVYAALGADEKEFVRVSQSRAVEDKIKEAGELARKLKVTGTPEVIVNGKYRILIATAGGYDRVFQLVDFLTGQNTNGDSK